MKVSIKRAASELGVHQATLRRWEAAGKIQAERTPKGHRRYDLTKLRGVLPKDKDFSKARQTIYNKKLLDALKEAADAL
jgi:predicted site-specific integrase-resolvase